MARTSYLIKPGTTAEDLAEERAYASMLSKSAADTSPKGHWAHIPAQALQGLLGGYEGGEIEAERRRQADEASSLFAEAFDSLAGAPSSSGATPGAAAAAGGPAAAAAGRPSLARSAAAAAGREAEYDAANPDVLGMIRREEGFAPVAKWDVRQNSGGYGSKAAPGETFTTEKAEQYLQRDAAPVMAWVNRNAPAASPQQKEALLSFGYNLGVDDLEKLKPDIQAGDWARVGQRMLSFNKAAIGPGGALQPMEGLTSRRQREAAALTGPSIATRPPGAPAPASIATAAPGASPQFAPRRADRLGGQTDLVSRLYRNEATRPIATAILQAQLTKDKDGVKRHVVAPGATLTDDQGQVLYQAAPVDETAKARQQAIGKAQGEARNALPAAVSRAEETVGILDKIRTHPGLDSGTGMTGVAMTRVPGTDAYDFDQLRTQAQGTAFLTAIGEMRGTGAISNVEGEAATQAVARMRAAQSKGAFLEALDDYERVVRKGVANTYRQAGLEVPPALAGQGVPRAGGGASPAGGVAPGGANVPSPASAAPEAPAGLTEGMRIRDTQSNEVLVVRGGKLIPEGGAAPRSEEAPQLPGMRAAAGARAAGDMGTAPQFAGKTGKIDDFRNDRILLEQNPSPVAMQAFNRIWGAGQAERVLRRIASRNAQPSKPYVGRGSYLLQGQ